MLVDIEVATIRGRGALGSNDAVTTKVVDATGAVCMTVCSSC
jgi:hypothetical protein